MHSKWRLPGKVNPADVGTKYTRGGDVLRISEWINLEDEVDSERTIPQSKDDEERRPESKA